MSVRVNFKRQHSNATGKYELGHHCVEYNIAWASVRVKVKPKALDPLISLMEFEMPILACN